MYIHILKAENFAKEAREAVVACAAQNTQEQQAVEAAKVKARCCRTTTLYILYSFLQNRATQKSKNRARPQLKSPANNIIQSVPT